MKRKLRNRDELYECQQSRETSRSKCGAGLDWKATRKQDTRYSGIKHIKEKTL